MNEVKVGDLVSIKYSLYIFDYHKQSHHLICRIDHSGISERYSDIYLPVDSKIFNYIKPIKEQYSLPPDFNLYPQTVEGKGKYLFSPKIPSDFSETGMINWVCIENTKENFSSKEGIRTTPKKTRISSIVGESIKAYTISGVIDRIYKKKTVRYNFKGIDVEYFNSVTLPKSLQVSLLPVYLYIAVIIIEDYEIECLVHFLTIKNNNDQKN